MQIEFDAVQIFVSNVQKAKRWFSENLGMKLIKEYPKIKCALMELNGVRFYIETPCPEWGLGWDKVKIGGRTPIIFKTKNIWKVVDELKSKGVRIVEEVSKRPWGEYKAVFADPDGNEFNLVQEV